MATVSSVTIIILFNLVQFSLRLFPHSLGTKCLIRGEETSYTTVDMERDTNKAFVRYVSCDISCEYN